MDPTLFPNNPDFTPTREAGLARLRAFTPSMGRRYATERNYDFGPARRTNVSTLSPWVSCRRVLEAELAEAVLGRFALSTAEKFIQEVCWRTYFKGWLEHRPSVWDHYTVAVASLYQKLGSRAKLRTEYETAIAGKTGIDCFDAWAQELVETGYLHNHARMWFASIWIFTLKLPWELGADFFLRHLMDADAASNTCSWRWVGGLHTPGKTYLARRANIEKYADGRFSPHTLAGSAPPLEGENPQPGALPAGDPWPDGNMALLLHEDDLHVASLRPPGGAITALAGVDLSDHRSPAGAGAVAGRFTRGALADALREGEGLYGVDAIQFAADRPLAAQARDWARRADCKTVITGQPMTGWVKPHVDRLRAALAEDGVSLLYLQRDWDRLFWPHAKRGFFGLKKAIPSVFSDLGLVPERA